MNRRFGALIIASSFAFTVPAVAAPNEVTVTQLQCAALQKEYQKMSENMPMAIDEITHLSQASAIYQKKSDECKVNVHYDIDAQGFVESIASESGGAMTVESAGTHFRSPEGIDTLKMLFKLQNENNYSEFDFVNFDMRVHYTMDSNVLPDISVKLF